MSYGKTRPIIQTSAPEERNRRTVTEVSGFVKNNPMVLNGKYAQIIYQQYVRGAVVPHRRTDPVHQSTRNEVIRYPSPLRATHRGLLFLNSFPK